MKKYLGMYLGAAADVPMDDVTPEQESAMMAGWENWAEEHAEAIVDSGTPLGKTKKVPTQGITDTKNNKLVYTIVQAESHEVAAKIFEHHRHATVFPHCSNDVMECLSMKGM